MTDPLETLRQYQQWARGGKDQMLDPVVIGQAIDAVMAELTARRADGDTCGRVCEGTAYRIAARQEKARADALALAEEGAKEAFGHVVQQKRDLEAECIRLRGLLDGANDTIRRMYQEKAPVR